MVLGCNLKVQAALALTTVFLSSLAGASNEREWLIGIYGPITSLSHSFLAGAVAFDLDFRKHFEPHLVDKLGPPVVEIPDPHPLLQQVGVVIGTSHSDPEVGGQTALEWALSERTSPRQVVALVGGFHSGVATRIASLLANFKTPQVAYAATSPALSNKWLYPFFMRTMPSDATQGQAMWAWMQYFSIRLASVVYAQEPYGEGLFEAVGEAAGPLSDRIQAVSLPYMPDTDDYDLELARVALQGVSESGSRFILMALFGSEAASALYLLEQGAMLTGAGGYQVLGSEAVDPLSPGLGRYQPSYGSLIGLQRLYPVAAGPRWPKFEELWTNLTLADLYGEDARNRYMLESMQVRLEDGRAPTLTAEDLTSLSSDTPGAHMVQAFLFDGAYTVVLAINALLKQGVSLDALSSNSTILLQEMKATEFDGVTGRVSFDPLGDRDGLFNLWNLQESASIDSSIDDSIENSSSSNSSSSGELRWVLVGVFDPSSQSMALSQDVVWTTGESSPVVPASLLTCPIGFQRESATNLCQRCRPGIGCGFRIEDGFPIGIFGPITTLDNEILALAVLFDLDFRKHREPALQERFGPPIVNIPDLHPDLKIKTQVGTSHSQVDTAVGTALDWAIGAGDFYRVAGIVGGLFSSITRPVASTAAVYQVPQIGWGASSPDLSDKTLYPWFSRVNPPDSLQGEALWVWMVHYGVPSASLVYTRESYGEGIFQALTSQATLAGEPQRISGVSIRFQTANTYNINDDIAAAMTVKSTGQL